MKIRVNRKKKLIALFFKSLQHWAFFHITNTGEKNKRRAEVVAYNPVFQEAVTEARKEDKSIPQQGWDNIQDNDRARGDAITVEQVLPNIWNYTINDI